MNATVPLIETDKGFSLVLLTITSIALALRVWSLSSQPATGDDVAVGISAVNYMEGGQLGPTMWNHPVLRNMLVYTLLRVLGAGVWGLKLFSIVFGTLTVAALGICTKRLVGSGLIASLAALFLALDPLHIDFSRQAVHEVYMAFFVLSGILFAVRFRETMGPLWLLSSGFCFGLGISSKWYVVFPLFVTCLFVVIHIMLKSDIERRQRTCLVIFALSSLLLLPATIYLVTFTPWFRRGYDFGEWLGLQKYMLLETRLHTGYNPYGFEIDHHAYLWFVKPVAFADFAFSGGKATVLLGMSNPLVWVLTIPSTLYVTYKGLREKNSSLVYLSALFFFTYLPFLLTTRPLWAHTAFSVLPFALTAVSYTLSDLGRYIPHGRRLLTLYLVCVIAVSVPLYFMAVGKGLEIELLRPFVESYRPSFER